MSTHYNKLFGVMAIVLALRLFSNVAWSSGAPAGLTPGNLSGTMESTNAHICGVDDSPAPQPSAPAITVRTNGLTVTVSWNSVGGATGYTLFYAPYPSAAPIRSMNMGTRTSLSATLGQGAAFYVAVKAYNADGSSGYSNISHFTLTAPNGGGGTGGGGTSGGGTTTNAGTTVTDIDGNVYNTVTIGAQTWMKENFKATKYRNGDAISTTTPATLDVSGEASPKYQWAHNGNESNAATYGRLYTWHAAADSRGLCPSGWHLPTDAEWTTLTDYLGGENAAGGKMREAGTAHWLSPNTSYADNSSGFTALPGGSRYLNGTFGAIGFYGSWWSATGRSAASAWYRSLDSIHGYVNRDNFNKNLGFSARCVKD